VSKDYIYSGQGTLFGHTEIIGFGTPTFYIKEIERGIANDLIIKNHYSHKFYNASYIHLGVHINDNLLGVLQYGYAMNPASQNSVVKNTEQDEYLELNRMWIDDKGLKNSESKAILYSIKYIKKKHPKIKWIQSFADERCKCFGIVYQACSFNYYGEHKQIFWELENVVYHNSLMTRDPNLSKSAKYLQLHKDKAQKGTMRQFRYIKFVKPKYKKDCLLKEQPYPKYYKESA
jgi:hypothetical protein